MHQRSKLLLAALVAAIVLGAATGAAQARRLEINNRSIKIVWSELVYRGGGAEISCPVTYEGTFHSRTIAKVNSSLIGYITSAFIGQCSGGGNERYLTETLPWHIQYNSFQGTLPNITGVRIAIIGLSWNVFGIFGSLNCLFRSTQSRPLFGIVSLRAGRASAFRQDESIQVPLVSGEILCPTEIGFEGGSGSVTTQEGRELVIRLVA